MSTRRITDLITDDGLRVYDLDVNASELWAVAGPDGYDPDDIDPDNLWHGFRWVENDEWERLCNERADDLSNRND